MTPRILQFLEAVFARQPVFVAAQGRRGAAKKICLGFSALAYVNSAVLDGS